jgi:hypothetical protein
MNTQNPTLGELFNTDPIDPNAVDPAIPPANTIGPTGDDPGDLGPTGHTGPEEDPTGHPGESAETGLSEVEETEEDEVQIPEEFYATLDQLYGEDINAGIDYGDNDPLSPQGVFIRENYVADMRVARFEESIKTNDPRGYAYLLHRQTGGSDEEFFAKPSTVLPDLQAVKDSVDLQRKVYQQVLLSRGNTEKQAERLVNGAIEDGNLVIEAEAAYTEIKKRETDDFERADALNKTQIAKEKKDLETLDTVVNSVITSGDGLKLVIPEADKQKFASSFKNLIHYDNGELFLLKPFSEKNLNKVMEAELFDYLGGDLRKLVERKATTLNAKRVLGRINKGAPPKGGHTPNSSMTLGDVF